LASSTRVYRCGELRVGEKLRRDRGLKVGATVAHTIALCANQGVEYGAAWPVRVFEGSVKHEDVLSTEMQAMHVRELLIEREVPIDEVFGPRADEVIRFVGEVDRTRWLRPNAPAPTEVRLAELVEEHYAALAEYGAVARRPVSTVRTWHEARDVYKTVEPRPEVVTAAINAACLLRGGTTAQAAVQLAQHKVTRSAYVGAWEAAWVEAGRSAATGVRALPWLGQIAEGDDHCRTTTATRTVEGLIKALGAAREPARRAGWHAAYDLFTYAPGDIPQPEIMYADAVTAAQEAFAREVPARPRHSRDCTICAGAPAMRNGLVEAFIHHTGFMVWTVAMIAAQLAGWRVSYLINALPQPDPWRPLFDIWRLGGCPLGTMRDSFLIFLPEPRN
jgi:hypothetical protein